MGKKSRDKGKRGELEWRDRLRTHGYVGAERGAQRSGSPDSPDVKVPSLAGLVHFEVKRAERLSLWSALKQATDEAGEAMPVVAHRPNGKPWVCVLRGEDLLWLLTQVWQPEDADALLASIDGGRPDEDLAALVAVAEELGLSHSYSADAELYEVYDTDARFCVDPATLDCWWMRGYEPPHEWAPPRRYSTLREVEAALRAWAEGREA